MFGLGIWEILIILGLALIFIGPAKLPDLARALGRGLGEFRRATSDLRDAMDEPIGLPAPEPEAKETIDALLAPEPETEETTDALPTPEPEAKEATDALSADDPAAEASKD